MDLETRFISKKGVRPRSRGKGITLEQRKSFHTARNLMHNGGNGRKTSIGKAKVVTATRAEKFGG